MKFRFIWYRCKSCDHSKKEHPLNGGSTTGTNSCSKCFCPRYKE